MSTFLGGLHPAADLCAVGWHTELAATKAGAAQEAADKGEAAETGSNTEGSLFKGDLSFDSLRVNQLKLTRNLTGLPPLICLQ